MKILVLGGSSFTGGAFVKLARGCGHEVMELNRSSFDMNHHLPERAAMMARAGYRRVVNFIALNMVAESWEYAADYYQTNVVGVSRLCKLLVETRGLEKFVQVSTPEVYGTTGEPLKEGAPFNPSTPYAVSRAACDMHMALLHREYGFPVCFTRSVNVYGPGQQTYRIIPKTAITALRGIKLPLHGGGVSARSFVHVRDMASAIYRVVCDGKSGETYHSSTDRLTRIRDLVEMVCDRCKVRFDDVAVEVAERPGKDMNYHLDSGKIKSELGWEPMISLEDGLDEVVRIIKGDWDKAKNAMLDYEHRA